MEEEGEEAAAAEETMEGEELKELQQGVDNALSTIRTQHFEGICQGITDQFRRLIAAKGSWMPMRLSNQR